MIIIPKYSFFYYVHGTVNFTQQCIKILKEAANLIQQHIKILKEFEN